MRVPLIYKKTPIIGFDIGSQTIKLVQLTGKNHRIKLVGYGFASIPPGIILEGIISDPRAIGDILKPLFKQLAIGKLSSHRVAASLPVAKTFIKTLDLPKMNKEDLSQAIQFQAEQYIPMAISDLYLDYEIISEDLKIVDKEPHMNVLLAATPRAIVDSYIQLFDYLHFQVDSIEISVMALARIIKFILPLEQTVLLADIGHDSTGLTIFNKVLRYTGTVNVGSNHITHKLSKELDIPIDRANKLKTQFGIAHGAYQSKILTSVKPIFVELIEEIKKAIKYYEDRTPGNKITTMVISGGGANMPGIKNYLSEQTGLKVESFDPWSKFQIKPLQLPISTEKNIYDTAIGLALRGVGYD